MATLEYFQYLLTIARNRHFLPVKFTEAQCGLFNNRVTEQLICGPYPGVDGINYPTETEACENLRNLANMGVTTFISLQQETTPQTIENNGMVEPEFFWAFPKYINYAYLNYRYNINPMAKYYHIPIADNNIPDHDKFIYSLCIILELLLNGDKIFIHCAGGHGRTGLYIACLLMSINNITYMESLRLTQDLHDSRKFLDRRQHSRVKSPSNHKQIKFVEHYAHFLTSFVN